MRIRRVRLAEAICLDGGGGDDPAFGSAAWRVDPDDYPAEYRIRFPVVRLDDMGVEPVGFDQVIRPECTFGFLDPFAVELLPAQAGAVEPLIQVGLLRVG